MSHSKTTIAKKNSRAKITLKNYNKNTTKCSVPTDSVKLKTEKRLRNNFSTGGAGGSKINFYRVITRYVDFHKRHMQLLTSAPNFRWGGSADPLTRPSRSPEKQRSATSTRCSKISQQPTSLRSSCGISLVIWEIYCAVATGRSFLVFFHAVVSHRTEHRPLRWQSVECRGHFAGNSRERRCYCWSVYERIMDGIANQFPAKNALDCSILHIHIHPAEAPSSSPPPFGALTQTPISAWLASVTKRPLFASRTSYVALIARVIS